MGLFEFVLGLLRGNMHVAVRFAGEWSKWSARITSHINGTKCGASLVCERSPTKVCENHALDSDSVLDSNPCFKKIRFRPRIESALSIGFGFGFD